MKSCPTCKRTFDDTTVFCLVDGAILSAPFDPGATLHLPNTNNEPPPTEVMNPAPNRLPPTIASPVPTITAQQANPIAPSHLDEALDTKRFRPIYIGVPLVLLLVGAGVLFYLLRASEQCPIIRIECSAGGYPNKGNCDLIVEEVRASTKDSDTSQLICSLNPAIAFQPPAIPKTVTKVSWTASSGKIDAQGQQFMTIDTSGLSGRQITVTAEVSGYGWRCSNRASTSFIAK